MLYKLLLIERLVLLCLLFLLVLAGGPAMGRGAELQILIANPEYEADPPSILVHDAFHRDYDKLPGWYQRWLTRLRSTLGRENDIVFLTRDEADLASTVPLPAFRFQKYEPPISFLRPGGPAPEVLWDGPHVVLEHLLYLTRLNRLIRDGVWIAQPSAYGKGRRRPARAPDILDLTRETFPAPWPSWPSSLPMPCREELVPSEDWRYYNKYEDDYYDYEECWEEFVPGPIGPPLMRDADLLGLFDMGTGIIPSNLKD